MTSKPIFISHAILNKDLADILVDLFETGIGVDDSQIFCSSLEGMNIPSGVDFVQFIKSQIEKPKIVVMLLTKEYFNSPFCLCELGASWAMSHKMIPLLVPPLDYKDAKAVLLGKQLLKINDKDHLNQMTDEVIKILNIKGKKVARWESQRRKFLKGLKSYLKGYKPIFSVTESNYNELKENYDDVLEELELCEDQKDDLEETIEKLKKTKNKEEVNSILVAHMDIFEQFEALSQAANESMSGLPSVVKEALFYHFRGDQIDAIGIGKEALWDDLKDADEDGYIEYNEEGVSLVEENIEVEEALHALNELQSFINSDEISEIEELYKENPNVA
ncbi:MAG: TIR domain-containing protein [Clostridiales bacterium]|nr:TIR domain-containing protein [Clostridiales bacterium]